MGNSPAKIERHYRKRGVTPEQAREWFSIMPEAPANVQTMPKPARHEAEQFDQRAAAMK